MKETYTSTLAKIEERLKNLIDNNTSQHNEIIDGQKELCKHVNHENELMGDRVSKLEYSEIKRKAEMRTIKIILAGVVTAIGLFYTILTILGVI